MRTISFHRIKEEMRAKEMIQIPEADGWSLQSVRGSHYMYKHPFKPGQVVVPFHGSKDIAIGTLKSILKMAQIVLSDARFEKGEE